MHRKIDTIFAQKIKMNAFPILAGAECKEMKGIDCPLFFQQVDLRGVRLSACRGSRQPLRVGNAEHYSIEHLLLSCRSGKRDIVGTAAECHGYQRQYGCKDIIDMFHLFSFKLVGLRVQYYISYNSRASRRPPH